MDNKNYIFDVDLDCFVNDNGDKVFCNKDCVLDNGNIKECYKDMACGDKEFMCSDGSCRKDPAHCPTETTCPIERPVKCFDGTCTTSIKSCPEMVECGSYTRRCPNGQCVSIESPCGTDVTCLEEVPVKCYDNTCRKTFDECPSYPTCPHNRPHLCSDGSCQPSIDHCYLESQCERNQIKCPDFRCVDDISKCFVIQGCPPGRYLCPDGSCRISYSLCMEDACPTSRPFKCTDGMCVQDEAECNSEATGCPFNTPHKCSDGYCVAKIEECERDIQEVNILCADGALADDVDSCYSVYGCPSQYPFMCHDGSCVDLRNSSCPASRCSAKLPYRCPDGQCVSDRSRCLTYPEGTRCNEGTTECGNGMCMKKKEFCRPLLPCLQGYVRCADGSCRAHELLCPITEKYDCNMDGRNIRCHNGLCVDEKIKCSSDDSSNGCAADKCLGESLDYEYYGRCVGDASTKCTVAKDDYIYNGCMKDIPNKNFDGSCVLDRIPANGGVNICPNGKILLVSNGCTELSVVKQDEYSTAMIMSDRKVVTPFVCPDGESAAISFMPFKGNSSINIKVCNPKVVCPTTAPYLCFDQSCESDPTHCPATDDPVTYTDSCPIARPILCSSGICVAKVQECLRPEPICGTSKPLRCANGVCVSSYSECIPVALRKNSGSMCDSEEGIGYLCPDGSCASSSSYCLAIINGCNDPENPIKKRDGTCGHTITDTTEPITCETKYKPCEDGICRTSCPDYNGCPIAK